MGKVYWLKAKRERYDKSESLVIKFTELLEMSGLRRIINENDIVAIKVHLGVIGGYRTIRPQFIRRLVDYVKELGGKPFITDTWGLKHLDDAYYNGISHATVNAPLIPANGIKENFYKVVKLDKYFQLEEVKVAGNIYDADVLINFAHGKGHGSSGYGGAIKNIAFGCTVPEIRRKVHSLEQMEDGVKRFQEAMVDVVKAVLSNKNNKVLHIVWLLDIVEICDCAPFGMVPFVPDIGILASTDIVALEKASLDLINKAPPLPWSIADKYRLKEGDNKFLRIHGKDPYIQVYAAERAGLGSTKYELIEL
ncbi:MAG: hypothetical protein B6U94_00215 [Thermofilum sp. ex4484_79]|nr:MAG: hypothetical protein B6U94_00215 [Thermofilum sp. ex4484_79]